MRKRSTRDLNVGLTPLIDVVFLLLIFFMVSSTFLRETELSVVLPEAEGSGKTAPAGIEVLVLRDGRYAINGRPLIDTAQQTLRRALQELVGEGSERPPLLVTADASASHQDVVRVMDVASRMGFETLSISTRAPAQ